MDKKDKVKEALKAKLKQETSVTGTGASVTPGAGEGVATKYAFGKRTNKGTPSDWKNAPSIPNRPSKAMDYKELWEDDDNSYMISKAGKKDNPHYILEKPDGSKQLDMFFSSPEEAKKYAEKKGIKISAQKGYNMEENIDKAEFADSLDEAYTPSTTNVEELARVEELLAQANRDNAYSVMSSYEFRIKALRLLVALEKKYNTTLPLLKFGMMVNDYLAKYFPGFKGKFGPYAQNWKSVKDHIEQSLTQKDELNENYNRFRNETKTRTKPEQFHNAVKEVKKKVNEINRLFEYMDRLQSELKESEGGLKTKKYTENALQQIKEATKQLFFKSTKLK